MRVSDMEKIIRGCLKETKNLGVVGSNSYYLIHSLMAPIKFILQKCICQDIFIKMASSF